MKIKKISKYVSISIPSRGSEQPTRRMLLSLPRIHWLERDKSEKYFTDSYAPESDAVELTNMLSYIHLTKNEKEIFTMQANGVSFDDIAREKNINVIDIKRIVDSANKKLEAIRNRVQNKNA